MLRDGRGDHVEGVNLRRSLDESCQRLQHLRVGIGVVTVSYTHLDVYKRQVRTWGKCAALDPSDSFDFDYSLLV